MQRRRTLLAVPPLAGVLAVVAATAKGIYVSPDAAFYIGTARNWVDGRGLTPPPGLPPLVHFPPLFTVVLAGLGKLGLDPLAGARVVNALAFLGVVILVGLVVRSGTGSDLAALVASVLTAAAVDLLTYAGSGLSEPLFILLTLSSLVVLATYLEGDGVPGLLALAAALAGAAFLTRYVGIALVLAGVSALLWRRRWTGAVVFGVGGAAPVAGWLAWAGGRGASDRTFAVHLFGSDYLGQAARPFSRWLVPWPGPPVGLVLAVSLVAGGLLLARRQRSGSPLSWLFVAFAVAYLAVLLGNRAFTDATGRLDARFLAPLHPIAIMVVVPALRRLPKAACALAAALVLAQVADAAAWTAGGLTDDSVQRRGYTSAALRQSPAVASVTQPDILRPVYTNAVDAVFFLSGDVFPSIPARLDYLTGKPNPRYAGELAAMRAALANPHGVLLYLDAVTFRRSFQPSAAELEAALPLEVVFRDDVATVYRLR